MAQGKMLRREEASIDLSMPEIPGHFSAMPPPPPSDRSPALGPPRRNVQAMRWSMAAVPSATRSEPAMTLPSMTTNTGPSFTTIRTSPDKHSMRSSMAVIPSASPRINTKSFPRRPPRQPGQASPFPSPSAVVSPTTPGSAFESSTSSSPGSPLFDMPEVSLPALPSQQPHRQPSREVLIQPQRQPSQQMLQQPQRQLSQQLLIQPQRQPSQQPLRQLSQQQLQQPQRQLSQQQLQQPQRQLSQQQLQQPQRQLSQQQLQQPQPQLSQQLQPPHLPPQLHALPPSPVLQALRDKGYSHGLAQELYKTAPEAQRIWILDNSGSMQTPDGQQLRFSKNKWTRIPCTRWAELTASAAEHLNLAKLVETPTTWRFLNPPGVRAGPQEWNLEAGQDVTPTLQALQKTDPQGTTPLTAHVNAVRERLVSVAPALWESGQQVVLVIATDGLPTDSRGESPEAALDFQTALQRLCQEPVLEYGGGQVLPVWVVIRLCTNDLHVVEYYNHLDQQLELPVEVLDDYHSEAKEIYHHNPWLNYTPVLHRCREWGYHDRALDILDERPLTLREFIQILRLVVGDKVVSDELLLPDEEEPVDWKPFAVRLAQVLDRDATPTYHPILQKTAPWLDLKKLDRLYGVNRRAVGRAKSGPQKGLLGGANSGQPEVQQPQQRSVGRTKSGPQRKNDLGASDHGPPRRRSLLRMGFGADKRQGSGLQQN